MKAPKSDDVLFNQKLKQATRRSQENNNLSLAREDLFTTEEISESYSEATLEEQDIARLKRANAAMSQRMSALRVELLHGKVKLQQQQLDMRQAYALKAYRFVWLWSIALIVILLLQGSSYPTFRLLFIQFDAHDFKLDKEIVIALISGVTINIVAVFVVVIRNLFPSDIKGKSIEEESTDKEKERTDKKTDTDKESSNIP
ncbi:hypothetical protein Dpoa2040_001785 [Dickeya sp. CFBP 2040]|uniref:Uncharacterized protein n=1 Tax=Dickeya poaceiphila TaxID=568768 RepID=A0A5B8HSZ5_9GAMM|nr:MULTISPECIES: hypothetical protein [Dickeya]NKI74516.1 hypothetical protein [Dickeya sp. CFBP 2040]QDX31699.1 hypothetical protein Dpoa569_0003763 [Dickeya poaceiphila]